MSAAIGAGGSPAARRGDVGTQQQRDERTRRLALLGLIDDVRSLPAITRLQQLKTGALIEYSVEAACIMIRLAEHSRTPYRGYARNIGLAFQIADDLIDHSGDEAAAGKRTGKDKEAGKATFVSLLGEERARQQAELLVEQAIDLGFVGEPTRVDITILETISNNSQC